MVAMCGVEPPEVVVRADNTRIEHSCRVVIPEGLIIPDADGNGVIHIDANDIRVEFAPGSVLRGAHAGEGEHETPWDQLSGVGIRVSGRSNVSVVNARVGGFKVGLHADRADGLSIDGGEFSDNFRQRLKSTPVAEDGADWLWPHNNDNREWMTNYGAAVVVERCERPTIRGVRVRRGQNGIIIDRVNHAQIAGNDCSFLSGWGLAMWRSSDNVIARNALDFCVRGHVEGVYNRGQDSAGILCFEQCSRNLFLENSATHGGDGFFGFAGKEAIGETPAPTPDFDYANAGCNDNQFIGNDFSYAPAHGLELTFSKRNVIIGNRFVENAICGIWGGYSNWFTILGNEFSRNGGMAYGAENGAINIEHGGGSVIRENTFENNRTGVHLWWDSDGRLLEMPGVKASYVGPRDTLIEQNRFMISREHPFRTERDASPRLVALRLRDAAPPAATNVAGIVFRGNTTEIDPACGVEREFTPGVEVSDSTTRVWANQSVPTSAAAFRAEKGMSAAVVGARSNLRGRDKIIMGEWGPWDHDSPMIRVRAKTGAVHEYEVFGGGVALGEASGGVRVERIDPADGSGATVIRVSGSPGAHAYELPVRAGNIATTLRGTLLGTEWKVRAFSWTATTDPRTDLTAWRALADQPAALSATVDALRFAYAHGGPRDQAYATNAKDTAPDSDRFGMIARTTLDLPAGRWAFRTLSDDGVRVLVNGVAVIDNWTWHAPTRDSGVYEQRESGAVDLVVEHFEIDGYSVLELDIAPAP